MDVRQIEAGFKAFLNAHRDQLPFGAEVEAVHVLAGRRRQTARKRRSTAAKSSDKGDSLFVVLRPAPAKAAGPKQASASPPGAGNAGDDGDRQLEDLLRALRAAEQTPGHSFVALKWFRDAFLPRQGYAWAGTPEARDQALHAATARGWVRVDKIPNPRNPDFPTSSLRIAAAHPDVQRLLGTAPPLGWNFPRVPAQGEPASETLRRMRDERY